MAEPLTPTTLAGRILLGSIAYHEDPAHYQSGDMRYWHEAVARLIVSIEQEAARAAAPGLDVERLMEWLHDLDLTQHYITHETGYDGDDIEGVACIDGLESHREDAVALLALIEDTRRG